MPFLNNPVFFLILFCWLFLLVAVALGFAPLSQKIFSLHRVGAVKGVWIPTTVGVGRTNYGTLTSKRRSRYRKFTLFPIPARLEGRTRDRGTEKVKWRPEASR